MAVPGLDPGISPGHLDAVRRGALMNRDHRHKAGDDVMKRLTESVTSLK
jgi:hypothetical protein